jgi:hypothetical protein
VRRRSFAIRMYMDRRVTTCPDASDSVWWTSLFVKLAFGDEEVVTELAAAEELTRRPNENGAPPCRRPSSHPTLSSRSCDTR